jgi:DNA mismatch repair protein MutS
VKKALSRQPDDEALQPSLPLFDTEAEPDPALMMLDELDPDELSPRQALALLYQLKQARQTER